MQASALQMTDIVKAFDGRVALDNAVFAAEWGEVHGLLGENGAGKTSLMNVLCGLYRPDAGRMAIDGTEHRIEGPGHARALGIGMVHQHFKLVQPFTVAENVMLANPQASWRKGIAAVSDGIARLSDELGFEIDPAARIDRISVAEQQRVEIIKVLLGGARLLILDEPTSVLTDDEAERLLQTIRVLARRGTCVILITHKLREVLAHADRVTVMRGGRTVATVAAAGTSAADLARMMVGDAPVDDTEPGRGGPVRLEIAGLTARRDDGASTVRDLTLAVRSGQIYGLAGVGGNGQTELAEVLMGVRAPDQGRIALDGTDIAALHPKRRRALGVRNVPADRTTYGLAQELSVGDNYAATRLGSGTFGSAAWVSRRTIGKRTAAALRPSTSWARESTPACACSPAATRRNWYWRANSTAGRRRSWPTRPPTASTCAPAPRCTTTCARRGKPAPRCCSSARISTRSSTSRTWSASSTAAPSWASWRAR